MLLEKINDQKFKTLTQCSLASVTGGAVTGGGKQFLGNYSRQVPKAVDFNGKINTLYRH